MYLSVYIYIVYCFATFEKPVKWEKEKTENSLRQQRVDRRGRCTGVLFLFFIFYFVYPTIRGYRCCLLGIPARLGCIFPIGHCYSSIVSALRQQKTLLFVSFFRCCLLLAGAVYQSGIELASEWQISPVWHRIGQKFGTRRLLEWKKTANGNEKENEKLMIHSSLAVGSLAVGSFACLEFGGTVPLFTIYYQLELLVTVL